MNRKIKIAITQLDVTPTAYEIKLGKAEALIRQAVPQGAQLVVLPELFTSGYVYQQANFDAAESKDGPTAQRMKQLSRDLNIHLAGSYLLRDGKHIYNALFLFAPDGQFWRYDKNYPWGWERAYFRGGKDICVAETALGRIGLMLCWDVPHAKLWQKYAGQVDMIVACTCPPNISDAMYSFADGTNIKSDQMGPLFGKLIHSAEQVFIKTPAQQCAWLGVPYISSTSCGKVSTHLPNPMGSFLGAALSYPKLFRYLAQAKGVTLRADMVEAGRVFDANGSQLTQLFNNMGESVQIAEIELSENKKSIKKQPKPPVSWLAYFVSDFLLRMVSIGTYRRAIRKMKIN
ncbi:MAG: carbon-nitrogen hydrolase family protein [Anaerolineaceae bacterium]|nr:carbon-nitrogen hydrolase family protein [Anaerolineaceae bacterium]